MDLKLIILSQYPALFLLSILFLISYLTQRKRSAVKSVLAVLLFGIFLAAAVVLCFLGIQQKYWTLQTLFQLRLWSWIGVAVVAALLVLHLIHSAERFHSRRVMEKELRRAERDKEDAVAQAREEGRAAARQEAEAERAAAAEAEAPARAADEAAAAEGLSSPLGEYTAPAEPQETPEAPADDEMPKFSFGSLFKKD